MIEQTNKLARLVCLAIAVLAIVAGIQAARADEFGDAIKGFASTDFGERSPRSRSSRRSAIRARSRCSRRSTTGALVIRKPADQVLIVRDGAAIDPATQQRIGAGQPGDDVGPRQQPPARRRSAARSARLTLFSPEIDDRLAAAMAVFKTRSDREPAAAREGAGREKDARGLARPMERSLPRRLLQLRQGGAARRHCRPRAVERYRGRAMLLQLSNAQAAIRSCARRPPRRSRRWTASLRPCALVQNLFQGLSLGSVLLLAAIGLAITFGVMGVINMAHGEMVMLGAYTTFVVQQVLKHVPAGG